MVKDKIVSLRGDPLPQPGVVNEATVEFFADLLERARSGEVQGFAGATMDSDKVASFYIIGRVGGYSMVGALQCAQKRLTEIAYGDD